MLLPGKRYLELDPTSVLANDTLIAVYRIGQPELERITFQQYQNNIRLTNLFDAQGETLTNRAIFAYNSTDARFRLRLLQSDDIPNLAISKITGLQTALNGKEPTFAKGSIVSNTLQIINGANRLVGSDNLEIDFDIGAINLSGTYVPSVRTLTINGTSFDLTENRTWSVGTVTSITTGTGLTGGPITATGEVSFDVPWGDNRYHNRLVLINNSSQFQFIGNVEGIQVRANTSGSTGFPNVLGMAVAFYTGSNDTASAMGRTLALFRTYNTESYYIGSSNTASVTNPWRLLWHSGNLDPANFIASSRTLIGGDGIDTIGDLSVNRTINVDDTVLRTTNIAQTRLGLLTIRRAGSNDGTLLREVLGFEIGDDDLYKMWIMNGQNQLSPAGEVNWWFRMREIYNLVGGVNFERLGFHRGGLTVLGSNLPSSTLSTDISVFTNAQVSAVPYQISTYVHRSIMVENKAYFGKTSLINTGFLGANDRVFSDGTMYARLGFRTPDPSNLSVLDYATWLFGRPGTFQDTPPDAQFLIRISIDGNEYDLLAVLPPD